MDTKKETFKRRGFDLLALGEILLRLSPPVNERLTRGDAFQKQAGGRNSTLYQAHRFWGCARASYQGFRQMTWEDTYKTGSASVVSAMIIWYMTSQRTRGWAYIITSTGRIRESQM